MVVDVSFFPVKLHLVSAAWIIVIGQLKLMKGEFILSVYERYQYFYTAELAGVLLFMEAIDHILSTHPHPLKSFVVEIVSDYLLVLKVLWNNKQIFSSSQYLYQIAREIYLLKVKWRIEFQPFKIEAYQDDLKEFNELTWEEKLNIWYDLRAKYLIQTEEKSFVL